MDRTPTIVTRKRRLAAPEQTVCTPSATDAQEIPSSTSLLQAMLSEIQQSREEQKRAQQEFAEALRQRDAEIQQLQRATAGLVEQQLSPSNNISSFGGVRDRVAHLCADRGDTGARAQECVEPRDSFSAGMIKLKPDTYDGNVALNEGKARVVLESVQNLESLSFDELKSRLELRFGETHSSQNYYSQFTNRRQKFGEEIASFGSDLERLARLAYPECSQTIRDKIACAQFVSALSDRFVSRNLQLEGVTSLREAIVRAKTIKSKCKRL